jgi:hypothetical protein
MVRILAQFKMQVAHVACLPWPKATGSVSSTHHAAGYYSLLVAGHVVGIMHL